MRLKTALYIFVYGSMVAAGVAGVIYFGLNPKTVPKIKLSYFNNYDQISSAVVSRIRLELQQANFLALGLWPDEPEQIKYAEVFIRQLQADPSLKYDEIIAEPQFLASSDLPITANLSLRDQSDQFVNFFKTNAKKRILYIGPSLFASQYVVGSPAQIFARQNLSFPITSLAIADLPRTRLDEATSKVRCLTQGDETGTGELGCLVLSKARILYRKNKNLEQYAAVLELIGGRDYMLLLGMPRRKVDSDQ
jgi:hypothetical protein